MRKLVVLGGALALSLIAAFTFPGAAALGAPHGEDIATLRNVSSLLFGILAGFFVAFLLNRFTAIRSLLSRESSMLMELYRLSQPFGPEFAARTTELIDTYLIDRFDGANYFSFTMRGRDSLFGLFDNLDTLPPLTSQNLTSMHRNFVATLRETIALRRETIVTGTITVSLLQWLPLLLLATILITSIFALKSDTALSSFLSGMLVFTIFTVLYVIKDLSDLNLGGEFLKFETIERVFDFMGRPRYYPLCHVREGLVPPGVERFRLGMGKGRIYSAHIIEVSREQALRHARGIQEA
ncbi:hypothetical protein WBP06_01055 [Novosphingobium sp. BL-8H]|uniref:bestrophin-like domain n=1 Tax=Novosphingobium sp. BL-8H TaxID=3127640 RepID=UPI003757A66A